MLWDSAGELLVELVECGTTVSAEMYHAIQWHLRESVSMEVP